MFAAVVVSLALVPQHPCRLRAPSIHPRRAVVVVAREPSPPWQWFGGRRKDGGTELALAAIQAAAEAAMSNRGSAADTVVSLKSAIEASRAYSWSIETIESSQGAAADAYSWSLETASAAALSLQTLGQERLQSLGLLPDWLLPATEEGEQEEGGLFAFALLVVVAFESLGPLALAAVAGTVLFSFGTTTVAPLALSAGLALPTAAAPAVIVPSGALYGLGSVLAGLPPAQLLGAAWLVCEAAFYLACLAVGYVASNGAGPAPFSADPRRRTLWRRMMADPSQSPAEFVEGWMYREDEVCSTPPHRLLAHWLRSQLLGRLSREAPAAVGGRAAVAPYGARDSPSLEPPPPLVEAYGVPYSQIAVGDVYNFLCQNLYFRRTREALTAEEDAELIELVRPHPPHSAVHDARAWACPRGPPRTALLARRCPRSQVDELEAATGKPLRRQREGGRIRRTSEEPTTPGVRHLSTNGEPVRWRHRPLLFYASESVTDGG